MKQAVLLINVGTPDKPEKRAVGSFLREFLMDPLVIDLPVFFRALLVRGIILPFRVKKSARLYQSLWTPHGSPLKIHLENLSKELQNILGREIKVFHAMRYGNPGLEPAIDQIIKQHTEELIVFPLYPQYAASTTQTAIDKVFDWVRKKNPAIKIQIVDQFYDHPGFIQAFKTRILEYHPREFDHVLFSFHGLPVRHIEKSHALHPERSCGCEKYLPDHGKHCYKATCYATARLLAEYAELPSDFWSVSFQSRLNKNWLSPFTDVRLKELAMLGNKRVLVVAPSFVADCLETLVEIKKGYREYFRSLGGEEIVLVESLNSCPDWIQGTKEILRPFLKKG